MLSACLGVYNTMKLTSSAVDDPGAKVIQHACQSHWWLLIAPQHSIRGESLAIVAECTLILISIQEVLLSTGDGITSPPLQREKRSFSVR